MNDTDDMVLPESPEVRAEKERRVYGEGGEYGDGKTRWQEGYDSAAMLAGVIIAVPLLYIIITAVAIWVI